MIAVSRLVDDAQAESHREPSHSDISYEIERVDLSHCDPNKLGRPVGKAKRVRAVLGWALENDIESGGQLVSNLISHLRGCGGFRKQSPNYVGEQEIKDAINAFREEGYELTTNGELRPIVLDSLSGPELTAALDAYCRRAKHGIQDAALVTGTSKDLIEATAAHVILELTGGKPTIGNFPTLLGQAFTHLSMETRYDPEVGASRPRDRLEASMYMTALAVNNLRNKEGTGHGRPWLPNVTDDEARAAVELMGTIAEYMLAIYKSQR